VVDLPKVPRRLVTTEAPRSRVSGEVVGAPMQMLGNALGTLGEGVEAAGVRIAEDEGRRAVTIGEDGTPKFEQMPAFSGKAGEAYNRVGLNKWAVLMQNKTEDEVLQKRLELRGDPEKFDEWGKAYIEKLATNEPDEKLRDIVKAQATNQVQQHYRALAAEKQNLDIDSAKTGLLLRSQKLENELAALARTGGTQTPEYQQRLADHQQIEQELTKNPLYKYPPELAAAARTKMEANHIVEAAIGGMDGIFTKRGKDAARKHLEAVAWDPKLNLSAQERTQLVSRGLARLEGLTSETGALVQGFRTEATQVIQNYKRGIEIDPRTHEELLNRAERLGDVKSSFELRGAFLENQMLRSFRAMPDSQKPNFVRDLNAGLNLSPTQRGIKDKVVAEAVAQGIDPAVATMVAYRESRLDPTAANKSGAVGVFQLMKQQRELYSVPDNADADTQIKAGITSLKARIADMTNRLGRAPNPAEVYLAHFQGAQGAETLLKANPDASLKATLDSVIPSWRGKKGETWGDAVLSANEWMRAYPTVGGFLQRIQQMAGDATSRTDANVAANPFVGAARANVAGVITQEMTQGVSQMVTNFIDATKKRNAVNEDELNTLVEWIQITGKFDEGKKLAEHLTAYENGRLVAALPQQQRDALLAGLQKKAETTGLTRAESMAQRAIEDQVKAGTENLAANPHAEAPRQGIVTARPDYLNVEDPAAIEKVLPQRVATARAIQSHNPTNGPVAALDTTEIERLGPVLTQGDPARAASLLGKLHQGTSPEMFAHTIAQPAFKSALEGMVRSGDTTRMGAAFSALDVAYRTNPQQFEATFGKALYTKMSVWQANLSYLPPDRIADLLRKADDPGTSKIRNDLVAGFRAEAMKLADSEVLDAFGTRFLGVTFRAAQPNAQPLQAGIFKAEFADLYSQLRADGVDHENALKRSVEWQGRVWGTSVTNDNRLMRRPPESWAPMIDGSHAWMKAEVEAELTRALGAQYPAVAAGLKLMKDTGALNPVVTAAFTPIPNYQYQLVADPTTEGEITRFNQWKAANPGKTPPADLWPSYQLFVVDKDKREINLWERGAENFAEQGPFNIGSAAALQRQTVRVPRFRFSDSAIRARETQFQNLRSFFDQPPALNLAGALR